MRAIQRGLAAATGSPDLDGRTVGVVGLGKVGGRSRGSSPSAGARVVAFDVDAARARRARGRGRGRAGAVGRGALLARRARRARALRRRRRWSTSTSRCAASRRLRRRQQPARLAGRRGAVSPRAAILYVPDFLANCGGLINVAPSGRRAGEAASTRTRHRDEPARRRARRGRARTGEPPAAAAERQALERVERARRDGRSRGSPLSLERSRRRTLAARWNASSSRSRRGAPSRRRSSRSPTRCARETCTPATGCRPSATSRRRCRSAARPCARRVKALAEAGVLEVRRGQTGGHLRPQRARAARPACRLGWEVRVGEVAGVLEARRLLEPRVAQLAAVHAERGATSRRCRRRSTARRELAGKPDFLRHEDLFLQLDLAFHLAIARSTRQLDRRLADALAVPPARDRARHGDARADGPRVDDRHPRAHARRDPRRPTSTRSTR